MGFKAPPTQGGGLPAPPRQLMNLHHLRGWKRAGRRGWGGLSDKARNPCAAATHPILIPSRR